MSPVPGHTRAQCTLGKMSTSQLLSQRYMHSDRATCLGGKSRSRTPRKYKFSNKNSSPFAMTSRHPQYCGHPHCCRHPLAWVGSSRPSGACKSLLMGHPRFAWNRGGVGTRPWWLALLACGGTYWPLALEPCAMTSKHPHYCGHPHCRGHPPAWVGIQNANSAHGVLP